MIDIINPVPSRDGNLHGAVIDFDGTLSTLRNGWKDIMYGFMVEKLASGEPPSPAIESEVRGYLEMSAGIQTIFQMQWLAAALTRYGLNEISGNNPWRFKEEYNSRLLNLVDERIGLINSGDKLPSDFLIKGSCDFLEGLSKRKVKIYIASGTDDKDLRNEADVLGISGYCARIIGAPRSEARCPKETLLKTFKKGLNILVAGDGPVEIRLGKQFGAAALGVAGSEREVGGADRSKREKLIEAGADAIVYDYSDCEQIFDWLNI